MYKFDVYQNINIPPVEIGNINKSRYSIDDYVFERTLSPVWSKLEFKWSKYKERPFFRKELDGSFTLIGTDYEWANWIRTAEYEINRYRYVRISEKVDNIWNEVWVGFLSVADGKFNISDCYVEFSDLLVFDKYTPVIENIENEVNLIDVQTTHTVSYDANQYDYDSVIQTEEYGILDFCGIEYWEVGDYFNDKFTLYSKKYKLKGGSGVWDGTSCAYGAVFTVIKEWRRDGQWASGSPGVAWEDTGDEDVNGNHWWVRHYQGVESPSYSTVTTEVEYTLHPSYNEFKKHCAICPLYEVEITFNGIGNLEYENDRARTLQDAIIYAIKDYVSFFDADGNLLPAYSSQFFSGALNPVTGLDNKYRSVLIFQISDMKPTSDAATKAMYSIKTLEDIFSVFECKWYINDNGYFIVEHKSFFDNGLSYDSINEVGLDISDMNIKTEITYSEDLPYRETMSFAYSINPDFVGVPIDCYGNIVNRREDVSTKEHSFGGIATDLNQIVSNPNDVGNDGFFIMTAEINNLTQTATAHTSDGILTGSTLSNGYMSTSQLQDYFWRYGRSVGYGIMNRRFEEFTQKRIITHSDIVVHNCQEFNPSKLVRTSYGDGEVVEASQNLNDKKLTLTLKY